MRSWSSVVFFVSLLVPALVGAQNRYVVNSLGDAIPIPKGSSADFELRNVSGARQRMVASGNCGVVAQLGGNVPGFPAHGGQPRIYFAGHKDIFAQRFTVPYDGVIDSVFVRTAGNVGDTARAYPNMILRIHKSVVYEGYGPGWGDYTLPNRCWGYFTNVNDQDQGVAAFLEDASDSTWHSTYTPAWADCDQYTCPSRDSTLKTFPPAGEELWGLGGVNVDLKPNATCAIALGSLPPALVVSQGQVIFLSFTVPSAATPTGHPIDPGTNPPFTEPTAVSIGSQVIDEADRYSNEKARQFANWKFYEHQNYCEGGGWVAKGDGDFLIWYSLKLVADPPPEVRDHWSIWNPTSDTIEITVDAEDCNFRYPDSAGVKSVEIEYQFVSPEYDAPHSAPMINAGGTLWKVALPAMNRATSLKYSIRPVDVAGHVGLLTSFEEPVPSLTSYLYLADTGSVRVFNEPVGGSGSTINPSSFFLPPAHGGDTTTQDPLAAGTAGPFALDPGFVFAGDSVHFAWIGVNGGIAFSKSSDDTSDLNPAGHFTAYYLPSDSQAPSPFARRGTPGIPRNFVAVNWAGYSLAGAAGDGAAIRYQDDEAAFIVEWDSVALASSPSNRSTFRTVFHKDDGTFEFQYDGIAAGLDSAVVGVKSDEFNYRQRRGRLVVYQKGYLIGTQPRSNWNLRFWPMTAVALSSGWNLISYPGIPYKPRWSDILPSGTPTPFRYQSTYSRCDTIFPGYGYWVKVLNAGEFLMPSTLLNQVQIQLGNKWNLIGSLWLPVSKGSLTTTPPGLINTGMIIGYNGSFTAADDYLRPGHGYFVKSTSAGVLNLGVGSGFPIYSPLAIPKKPK